MGSGIIGKSFHANVVVLFFQTYSKPQTNRR